MNEEKVINILLIIAMLLITGFIIKTLIFR